MIDHPNNRFCTFLDCLPTKLGRIAVQQIQQQCFGTIGVNNTAYWSVKNWQQKKSVIPREFHHRIDSIAKSIYMMYISDLYAGAELDSQTVFFISLFNNTSIMTEEKTTIFLERAKRRVSQEELANSVGTSNQAISKLENGKYPSVRLELALKIANYFGKKIEDFQEFQFAK